jgi:hypothetical protein
MLSPRGDDLNKSMLYTCIKKTGAKLKLFFQTENALLLSLFFCLLVFSHQFIFRFSNEPLFTFNSLFLFRSFFNFTLMHNDGFSLFKKAKNLASLPCFSASDVSFSFFFLSHPSSRVILSRPLS